jgi:hypothetical protein
MQSVQAILQTSVAMLDVSLPASSAPDGGFGVSFEEELPEPETLGVFDDPHLAGLVVPQVWVLPVAITVRPDGIAGASDDVARAEPSTPQVSAEPDVDEAHEVRLPKVVAQDASDEGLPKAEGVEIVADKVDAVPGAGEAIEELILPLPAEASQGQTEDIRETGPGLTQEALLAGLPEISRSGGEQAHRLPSSAPEHVIRGMAPVLELEAWPKAVDSADAAPSPPTEADPEKEPTVRAIQPVTLPEAIVVGSGDPGPSDDFASDHRAVTAFSLPFLEDTSETTSPEARQTDAAELPAKAKSPQLGPLPDDRSRAPGGHGSFWERFFVDLPLSGVGNLQIDGVPQATQASPNGTQSPLVVLPLPVKQPTDIDRADRPGEEASRTVIAAQEAITIRSRTPTDVPVQVLMPTQQLPVPVLALTDWGQELQDQDDKAGNFGVSFASTASFPQGAAHASPVHVPASLSVPQVAGQITGALVRHAEGVTELALAPEELGHVRLRLKPDPKNPDRMVILISVERPETLDLFRRHAGELAEAMRTAGYSGTDIGFGQHGQNGGTDRQQHGALTSGAFTPDEALLTPTVPRLLAGASLDLRL